MAIDPTLSVPLVSRVPVATAPVDLTTPTTSALQAPSFDDLMGSAKAAADREINFESGLKAISPITYTPQKEAYRYRDPFLGFTANSPSLEETYARQQTVGDMWLRNIGQGAARATATFLGGFADIPDTIEALSGEGWAAYSNTPWKNELIDWSENVLADNPIYESNAVREANPFLSFFNPADWKTFNAKWGTLVNNLGFTLGAVGNAVVTDAALVYLTGGAGDLLLLPKQAATISKSIWNIGKSATNPAKWNELRSAFSQSKNIINDITTIGRGSQISNGVRFTASLFNSAVGEASVEGYTNQKDSERRRIDEYRTLYGADPEGIELQKIKNTAQQIGDTTIAANTALLMATNFVTFGKILNPSSAALNTAKKELIRKGVTRVTGNLDDIIPKAVSSPKTWYGKVWKAAAKGEDLYKTMASEGFEEGSQFFISKASEDYFTAKYKGSDEAELFWKSMSKGLSETLGSREGWDNIIMGALSGAVFHGGGSFKDYVNRKRKGLPASSDADIINNAVLAANITAGLTGSISSLHSEFSTQTDRVKAYERAVNEGNVELAKDLKSDLFFSWIYSASKNGLFQLRMEALDDLKKLNEEEFIKFWGIDYSASNSQTASKYVDLLKAKAENFKQISDKIEVTFGKNPFNPQKDGIKFSAYEDYKQALAHSLATIQDSEKRTTELETEVNKVLPTADVNNLVNLTNTEGLKKIKGQLEEKIANLKVAEENAQTNSSLLKPITNERVFLENQLSALQEVFDGIPGSQENFENIIKNLMRYFNNPVTATTPTIGTNTELDETYAKLNAIAHLRNRAILALDTYNTLRKEDGFEKLLGIIDPIIRGSFAKRTRVVGDKLTILSGEELAREEQEKALKALEELEAKKEAEIQAQVEEAVPAAEVEPTTNEEEELIESLLNNLATGEPLTEEEVKVMEEKPKAVERKKAEKEIRKEYEASSLKEEPTAGEEETTTTPKAKPKPKTVPDEEPLTPEEVAALKAENIEVTPLAITAPLPIEETTVLPNIEQLNRDSTEIDNLFGNVLYYTGDEKSKKAFDAFKKVKRAVEMPNNKIISSIYTDYILNNPIFKFIFGERQRVTDVEIEVTKIKPSEVKVVTVRKNLVRQTNITDLDAVLVLNGKKIGHFNNPNSLFIQEEGKLIPIAQAMQTMTADKYAEVTGFNKNTFGEFKNKLNAYQSMMGKIYNKGIGLKLGETAVIGKDVASELLAVSPFVNRAKYSYDPSTSTLLKDIKALGDRSYIISMKKMLAKNASNEFVESTVINVIGEDGILTQEQIEADPALNAYMSNKDNIKAIKENNSRYSLLNRLPNGQFASFSRVVARPVKFRTVDTNQFFQDLMDGNVAALQEFKEKLYITDYTRPKGSKLNIELIVKSDGSISFLVSDTTAYMLAEVSITPEQAQEYQSLADMLRDVNADFSAQMQDLAVVLQEDNFKALIKDDDTVKFSDFKNTLAVSTTPYYWNDIKLTIIPRSLVPAASNDIMSANEFDEAINKPTIDSKLKGNLVEKILNRIEFTPYEQALLNKFANEVDQALLETQNPPIETAETVAPTQPTAQPTLTTPQQNQQKNKPENLEKSKKIVIFAKEYDPTDIEGIAKARALEKKFSEIVSQLQRNNTIQKTKCK